MELQQLHVAQELLGEDPQIRGNPNNGLFTYVCTVYQNEHKYQTYHRVTKLYDFGTSHSPKTRHSSTIEWSIEWGAAYEQHLDAVTCGSTDDPKTKEASRNPLKITNFRVENS